MKNITFGYLLERLLYFSKQKKTSLAKALGYDISYISKWTSGKNLPTTKNINEICETTSKFIVESLTEEAIVEAKSYFQIENDINAKDELVKSMEGILKESYKYTCQKNIPTQAKEVYWQDDCNGIIHVNPRLRKQYLNRDIEKYISRSKKLDLIISANLNKLPDSDKIVIADIKRDLFNKRENVDSNVKILLGIDNNHDDVVFNTIMIINMIAMYPGMDFDVYNCEIDSNSIISIVKGWVLHTANFTKDKHCLLSSMSKDKRIIEEMSFSVESIIKNHGNLMFEKKNYTNIIIEKIFTQYFMTQDLRWLVGSMNELFMPSSLFAEVATSLFEEKEVLEELEKINIVLQNITYKSKLKVLIYASELKRYISSGKINFFNIPIELTFNQRKRHINYLKNIILSSENVEIKLIDGDFIEYFKDYKNPSLYLSKNIKLIQTDHEEGICDYAIIKDKGFKSMCDDFYNDIWNEDRDIIVSDKEEILDILEKELTYASIINENYTN